MKFNPSKPHNLASLPPNLDCKTDIIWSALCDARAELAELKGYSSKLNNPMVLLTLIVLEEAVESNRIENIHTTVESVLKNQLKSESTRKGADKEARKYLEALYWAMEYQPKYSLLSRLIFGIHKILLGNSHGYRHQQNAIANKATGDVIYTPPPAPKINDLIQNWETFVNNPESDTNYSLIKCAIAHYQFEAIHPFMDGNGRTGRVLMALQLAQENFLDFPILYTSAYLSKRQSEYYSALKAVTEKGDWQQFVLFMLEAFKTQSKKTKEKLFKLDTLYQSLVSKLEKDHQKLNAQKIADHLFGWPFTTPAQYARALKVHSQTASKHLRELAQAKILIDYWEGKRHIFVYGALVDLYRDKNF